MADTRLIIAMVLSFFFSGIGLAYLGDVKRGLIFFALSIVFNLLYFYVNSLFGLCAFIVWIVALYLTYKEATEA